MNKGMLCSGTFVGVCCTDHKVVLDFTYLRESGGMVCIGC